MALNQHKRPPFFLSELRRFSLAGIFAICLAVCAFGQISSIPDSQSQTGFGGANSIEGTVFGPNGRPVETRVRIRLSSMTSGDRTTSTNDTGNFAFRGLPGGSFTITIDREKEFKPVTHSVDIVQFRGSPGQAYSLQIRLELKQSDAAAPGVVDAGFAGVPEKAIGHFNAAIGLAKKGEHAKAIESLASAISEHPNFVLAHNETGLQYLKLGKVKYADEAFQKALKIDPAAYAPNLNWGMVLVFEKRYGEAAPVLRKAIEAKPEAIAGHYFLGQALANLGLFDEAEKELVIAAKSGNPEVKEAHRTLAIIYNSKGDKKRAILQLEAYLKAAPNAPDSAQLRTLLDKLKSSN